MESSGVLHALWLQRVRQSQASGNSDEPSSIPFFPFPFPFSSLPFRRNHEGGGGFRYSRCCCCISCYVASSYSQGVPAARNMTPWDDALHRRNGTNKLGQEKAAAVDEFWPTTSKWRGRLGQQRSRPARPPATIAMPLLPQSVTSSAAFEDIPGIQGHRLGVVESRRAW